MVNTSHLEKHFLSSKKWKLHFPFPYGVPGSFCLLGLEKQTGEEGNATRISSGLKTLWSWGWMLSCQAAVHCWVGAVKPRVSAQASRALLRHLPDGWKWAACKTLLCTVVGFLVFFFFWLVQARKTTKYFPKYPLDVTVLCRFKCPLLPPQVPPSARVPARTRERPRAPLPGAGVGAGAGAGPRGAAVPGGWAMPRSWALLPWSSSGFQGKKLERFLRSRLRESAVGAVRWMREDLVLPLAGWVS